MTPTRADWRFRALGLATLGALLLPGTSWSAPATATSRERLLQQQQRALEEARAKQAVEELTSGKHDTMKATISNIRAREVAPAAPDAPVPEAREHILLRRAPAGTPARSDPYKDFNFRTAPGRRAPLVPSEAVRQPRTPGVVSPLTGIPVERFERLHESGTPNLRVTRLEYVTGEMRFRVSNAGTATKQPGEVRYRLRVLYTNGEHVHEGTAGMTSLARIAPGQEGPEDRASGYAVDAGRLVNAQLCINPDGGLPEQDTTDNCRSLSAEALRWRVTVRLERVKAHGDGDNVSPGDWMVALAARAGTGSVQRTRYPDSGSKNVDSGSTVAIDRAVVLDLVAATASLTLEVAVADCDSGGALPVDIPGLNLVLAALGTTCPGEEAFEASGANDVAGTTVTLAPAQWRPGGEFAYRVTGSGLDYTAYLRIEAEAY